MQKMNRDATEGSAEDHLFGPPLANSQYDLCLVSRSRLLPATMRKFRYKQVPPTKKEFGDEIIRALGDILLHHYKEVFVVVDLTKVAIVIVQEKHRDGTLHYHAIIIFPAKTRILTWFIETSNRLRTPMDCRVYLGESGPISNKERCLRYVLVPTADKPWVDLKPRIIGNYTIPIKIWDEQKRSINKLEKTPMSNDEIFHFCLKYGPQKTCAQLDKFCKKNIESMVNDKLAAIPYIRASKWISSKGVKCREEWSALRDRVLCHRVEHVVENGLGALYEEALEKSCKCRTDGLLLQQLTELVAYHDRSEVNFKKSQGALGLYFKRLLFDGFPDRKACFLLIGAPGSGKSTVGRVIPNLFSDDYRCLKFTPIYDSNFPFDGFNESVHILLDLNDLRLSEVSKSVLLNVMEGNRDTRLSQKGTTAAELGEKKIVILTTNSLDPVSKGKNVWNSVDTRAIFDRVFLGEKGGIRWDLPLPQNMRDAAQQNAATTCCAACSAKFIQLCMKTPFQCADSQPTDDSSSSDEEEEILPKKNDNQFSKRSRQLKKKPKKGKQSKSKNGKQSKNGEKSTKSKEKLADLADFDEDAYLDELFNREE
jgi:hypothetical protein